MKTPVLTKHEKVIARPDKSKVLITVRLTSDFSHRGRIDVEVRKKAFRKRNWEPVYNRDDFRFRGIEMKDRSAYITAKQLEHVTKEEIREAKLELVQAMQKAILETENEAY